MKSEINDTYKWRFSFSRVFVIAKNTFTQLVRLKVFYFLILFVILLLAAGFLFMRFSEIQKLKLLKDISFGSISMFSWIFGISATSMLIPKDVEDRTLYTILSKPIARSEYLLGKFFGVMSLIVSIVLIMSIVSFGAIEIKKRGIIKNLTHQADHGERGGHSSEENAIALNEYKDEGFSLQLVGISFSIILKASVIVMVTLMISTFSSSFLFTLLISFIVFFIGHFQFMLRDYWLSSKAMPLELGKLFSLLFSILFPNLKRFDISDVVIGGTKLNLYAYESMFGLALMYLAFYYLISCLAFSNREL